MHPVLLTVRVWALWNRDIAVSIALPIGFLGIWVPASIAGYYYIQALHCRCISQLCYNPQPTLIMQTQILKCHYILAFWAAL